MPDTHDQVIDEVAALLGDAVDVAAVAYPPLALAAPLLKSFIKIQAWKLKTGLADGTIVPDGQGGFVPITNSRYDPKTGRFL